MQLWRTARLVRISVALGAMLVAADAGCKAKTAPSPVQATENFTGTLQPLGSDFKTFTVNYAQGYTDLGVTVNSLVTVANSTPVTGITIGIGFGNISANTCAEVLSQRMAPLGQQLAAQQVAVAGTYCVQISDCPTGTTGCTSTLTEPVNYSMTVIHY